MLKRLLLSRTTTLALCALALGAVAIAALIPQTFVSDEKTVLAWRAAHRGFAPLCDGLGLFHVFTTPGFALVLTVALLSLSLSTVEQWRGAWRKTFSGGGSRGGTVSELPLSVAGAAELLRSHGYLRQTRSGALRLVRHPWGYWGNTLLHLGLVVTIAASLWIALTQQRGMQTLSEGETLQPGGTWQGAERGLLAGEFRLPEGVRLERVSSLFGADGALKRLASTVTFLSPGGALTRTVEINSLVVHDGVRVYQGTRFGHDFYVEILAPDGRRERVQLPIEYPERAEKASYATFPDLLGPGVTVRAKYFADAGKRSMAGSDPLLVLRLDVQGREVGQLPLRGGGEGRIGDFTFRLLGFDRYSQLIFVKLQGISVVFAGFFLLLLGGVLHYFTPPREILLEESAGGCVMTWQAVRFADFYAEEPAELVRALSMGKRNG